MKRHDHNFRCRDLLDAVKELPCQFRVRIDSVSICEGGPPSDPCHSNQQRHGKGASMKANDNFVAAGCRACHREIDQGSNLSRDERVHYWQVAHDRTMLLLWQMGKIRVAKL